MKLLYTLLGLVLLVSTVQAASITTIQLMNRPAAEVIPVIEPLLESGDAISGRGFKIFLRSSPETLAQVKEMVAALDTSSRILQISVFQGSTRDLGELGVSGNLQIEGGDASVSLGTGNNSHSGGGITYSSNGSSGSISGINSRKRLQNDPVHQLRVTEGTEAFIETGEQIPYFTGSNRISAQGVAGGIDYKDVVTGFYVLPRIHGDNVTLQISPFKNSLTDTNGGSLETRSTNTTITGRIGDWLLVGGVSEQLERTHSGTGSHVSTQSRSNDSTWIKAELVQ